MVTQIRKSQGGFVMKAAIPLLGAALLLAGCAAPTRNLYEATDVGRVIETYEGTVVSSRIVKITDPPRGLSVGPLAGAAAGTGIGLTIGEGRGNTLAAILGGLIGAGTGFLAEQSAKEREGLEYVIRTADGRVVTVVQNRDSEETPIAAGTAVLLQYGGSYTRVIERPKDLDVPDNRWMDPDRIPNSSAGQPGAGSGAQGRSSLSFPPSAGSAGAAAPLPRSDPGLPTPTYQQPAPQFQQ
jgi:outer membrane lipoprotein SlyB